MTVSYSGDVGNASSFGCFNKILLKWRGSVYKLVYKELIAYIVVYFLINLFYRAVLVPQSECNIRPITPVFVSDIGINDTDVTTRPITPVFDSDIVINDTDVTTSSLSCRRWKVSREMFEALRGYCHHHLKSIPLMFVLGFYVSLVVQRWWDQYVLLPWPDSFAIMITGFLVADSGDLRARLMRRNVIRYITLSYCIALRTVSFRLKKRFPSLDHLIIAGLMRPDELELFHKLDEKVTANKWFLPLVWASKILTMGLAESRIRQQTISTLMMEVCKVREKLTLILSYDWISVPLVYTQLVTLAVYSYFLAALFGSQWVQPASAQAYKDLYQTSVGGCGIKLDLWYPFFLTLQFAFFVGWLKVAETLINPFGEDDDDFELNRLLDRHIQVGFLICDPLVEKPDLLKDKFWDQVIPDTLPYTKAAEEFKKPEFEGSAEKTLKIKDSDKIYSDTSVYGFSTSRPMSPSSEIEPTPGKKFFTLTDRLRSGLSAGLEDDSTDDNYEQVTAGGVKKSIKRMRRGPPLPKKNNIAVEAIVEVAENSDAEEDDFYSTMKKRVKDAKKAAVTDPYNEDDEEFEEFSPLSEEEVDIGGAQKKAAQAHFV